MNATSTRRAALVLVSLVGLLGGCVSKGRYDEAVAATEITRAELQKKSAALAKVSAELAEKNAALDKTSADLAARQREIARMTAETEQLLHISRTDKTVSQARIDELSKRLSELQAAQRAAEARAALYRDLTHRLKKQIDAGELTVIVRDGRMVLALPNDVLFDTGRTEIKTAGKQALEAIAGVLTTFPNRQFQVAGHTDNVPIKNERFPSNWELSAGRALGVVHFLIGKGVDPAMLSAAGYGEVDPVKPNDTAANRKYNRRTEITLQPNIDELVPVP